MSASCFFVHGLSTVVKKDFCLMNLIHIFFFGKDPACHLTKLNFHAHVCVCVVFVFCVQNMHTRENFVSVFSCR